MAPSEYSLRLQKGITGGFAPPTPEFVHTLTRPAGQDVLNISSATRPHGTPELQSLAPKQLKHDDHATLVTELHGILKQLPTESPPGSEDIYALDTSIFWGSEDLQWCNGGPQGCGGGTSSVQASEEDKKKFKRAVEIVDHLVNEAK